MSPGEDEAERGGTPPGFADGLAAEQEADPFLGAILRFLDDESLPADDKLARRVRIEAEQCEVLDGLLHHHAWPQRGLAGTRTMVRLAIPPGRTEEIMRAHHDDLLGGHLGKRRTRVAFSCKYWWPRMATQIDVWVASCERCQEKKTPRSGKNGLLEPLPGASRPFERVGMDLMGPFRETDQGNRWILVMVDYLSKWPIAVPLPDKKAETVARAFVEHLVCVHGAPESVLSDQGREFLNEVMQSVNADLRIHKLKTSAYHPQTDGLVERFNSTLQTMISMYVADHQRDWDAYMPYVLSAYRCSVHEATQETPFFLVYGRDPFLPIDIAMGLPRTANEDNADDGDYRSGLVGRLQQAFASARENQVAAQDKNRRIFNRSRTDRPYALGERVWLHVPSVRPRRSKKFTRPWRGPYRVVELRGNLNYGLQHVHNPRDHQFAHVSRLKQWVGSAEDCEPPTESGEPAGEDDGGQHEISEVLNDRTTDAGVEYLVRYKGFTDRHNAWVPISDIQAPTLILHYERGRRLMRPMKPVKPAGRKPTKLPPVEVPHGGRGGV
jgi:hypothetical protein